MGNHLYGTFLLVNSLNLWHKYQPAVYGPQLFPSGCTQFGLMQVFFKKKGFFKQKKSNLFQKISFETQIFNFPFLFNRLSTPSKKLGEQLKNTMSDQETVEPLFHLNKVILIRGPQRLASTKISNQAHGKHLNVVGLLILDLQA